MSLKYLFAHLLLEDLDLLGAGGEVPVHPVPQRLGRLRLVVHFLLLIDSGLVRSHEERRWLFEKPIQGRVSPSIL